MPDAARISLQTSFLLPSLLPARARGLTGSSQESRAPAAASSAHSNKAEGLGRRSFRTRWLLATKTHAAHRHQDFPGAIRSSSALVHSPGEGWAASDCVPRAGTSSRAGAQGPRAQAGSLHRMARPTARLCRATRCDALRSSSSRASSATEALQPGQR